LPGRDSLPAVARVHGLAALYFRIFAAVPQVAVAHHRRRALFVSS
jgi:hypothetical protein